jgi:hypothetical protein
MKSGKWWLLLLVPFVAVIGIDARDETACRTSKDCKGKHEDCIGGMCHCEKVFEHFIAPDNLISRSEKYVELLFLFDVFFSFAKYQSGKLFGVARQRDVVQG